MAVFFVELVYWAGAHPVSKQVGWRAGFAVFYASETAVRRIEVELL